MLYNKILSNSSFFAFLYKIDTDLASAAHKKPCSFCGGKLDRANYPRKPRGGSDKDADFSLRFSLCCRQDGCRKRILAPSTRYFNRLVYSALWFILISYFLNDGKFRIKKLQKIFNVNRKTLKRWKKFWDEDFPTSPLFKIIKSRLPQLKFFPQDLVKFMGGIFSGEEFVANLMGHFSESAQLI